MYSIYLIPSFGLGIIICLLIIINLFSEVKDLLLDVLDANSIVRNDDGVLSNVNLEGEQVVNEVEERLLKRDMDFDERIRKIKDELNDTHNKVYKRSGVVAETGEGIYNLPHGDIKHGYDDDGYEEISS